jgi:hypothetical protein
MGLALGPPPHEATATFGKAASSALKLHAMADMIELS